MIRLKRHQKHTLLTEHDEYLAATCHIQAYDKSYGDGCGATPEARATRHLNVQKNQAHCEERLKTEISACSKSTPKAPGKAEDEPSIGRPLHVVGARAAGAISKSIACSAPARTCRQMVTAACRGCMGIMQQCWGWLYMHICKSDGYAGRLQCYLAAAPESMSTVASSLIPRSPVMDSDSVNSSKKPFPAADTHQVSTSDMLRAGAGSFTSSPPMLWAGERTFCAVTYRHSQMSRSTSSSHA